MSKHKPQRAAGKNEVSILRSSAAEYLTFVAATGNGNASVEMRYEDENLWLTQKMMATLYDVSVPAISQHLKRIYADNELEHEATVKQYLMVQTEGDREVLKDAGKVTAEIARAHAESEFEKYRIVQDQLFESDFDRMVKQIGAGMKPDSLDE
jgi:hypothetical protein